MGRLFERNRTDVFSESIEHVVSRKPYFNGKVKAWLPCSVVSEVTASLMTSDCYESSSALRTLWESICETPSAECHESGKRDGK